MLEISLFNAERAASGLKIPCFFCAYVDKMQAHQPLAATLADAIREIFPVSREFAGCSAVAHLGVEHVAQ
jgi:hypothetical protein